MGSSLDFFSTPGRMSGLNSQTDLLRGLPRDLEALCGVGQGLLLHIFWAEQYGVQISEQRREEVQLRSVAQKLERILALDARPLTETREPDRRLVGNCRDFSLMLTALLRHQGIPARARCGFGRYFLADRYEDHWVCEYWNAAEERWLLVDAQLDDLQREKLSIRFDPLDVPRDQFIVGGKAWGLCRGGQADPETFGIFDMHGLWFVRGNLVRDVASLNKMELLPWDSWGIMEGPDEKLSGDDLALLDRVAELTRDDVPESEGVRKLYENDLRLRVPDRIRSYTQAGMQIIDLNPI